MPCPRTQHLNNVPRLRGEKRDISLKILHQAGFKTARQAATSAERHALTIAPCPSLHTVGLSTMQVITVQCRGNLSNQTLFRGIIRGWALYCIFTRP